jgi:hypothetical protein
MKREAAHQGAAVSKPPKRTLCNAPLVSSKAPDSSWRVAAYFNRVGFDECVVIELRGDN